MVRVGKIFSQVEPETTIYKLKTKLSIKFHFTDEIFFNQNSRYNLATCLNFRN